MKRATAMLVFALVASACGDAGLLDGVGDRVQDAVVGSVTTTLAPVDTSGNGVVLRFREAGDLGWWNDEIANQQIGEPSYTAQVVWSREQDSTIQASRAEIAAALPGISFPRIVAADIGWITSQLLYDVASAQLDPGTSAQFGLWAVEPYTDEESAVSVLRVGRPFEGALRGELIREVVPDGLSLIWTDGDYRYELFCTATLVEDYCLEMANSVVPLAELLPPPVG